MKTKNKLIAILILISISLFNFSYALADGMMIMPIQDKYAWDELIGDKIDPSLVPVGTMVGENSQQAFISWDEKKKTEKMMIVVDKESMAARSAYGYRYVPSEINKLFWIVPVKSGCEDVKPYHFEKFSNSMDVISVENESKNRLKSLKEIIYGMQVWPLVGKFAKLMDSKRSPVYYDGYNNVPMGIGKSSGETEDVTVYKRIESFGVMTEVLSAESFDGLENYLAKNYIKLDESSRKVIESYISGDYCFAVSNVTSPDEKGKLGLMLEFKTEKPFYPLYITSAYRNRVVRLDLYINGAVEANMGRSKLASQNYYLKNDFYYGKDDEIMFKKGTVLTNIIMNSAASSFTSDMYFNSNVLKQSGSWLKLNLWLLMLLAYFLISFVLGFFILHKGWIKAGILNSFLGIFGIVAGFVLPGYIEKEKTAILKVSNVPADEKASLVKSFRCGNRLIFAIPILMLFLVTMSIFGGYSSQRFLENLIGIGMGNSGFAFIFFFFMLPLAYMLATLTSVIRKTLESQKANLDMKEFVLGLMSVINNALETVLVSVSLILFFAMGLRGWVMGITTIIILLWSINYGKSSEKIMRKILRSMPFVFLIFIFFGLFGALSCIIILYPYLVNRYLIANAKAVSLLYEKMNTKQAENIAAIQKIENVSLFGRVAMYSALLVTVYAILDWFAEAILI